MNNLISLTYETLAICCLTGFAAYDIRTRRVPDRALIFFCPVALASLPIHMQTAGASFHASLGFSLAGCAAGFLILLTAALLSKDGTGVGGGDIKLAAATGFIYGPYRMLGILMIATLLSACAALIILCRRKGRARPLSLPFVPFIAAGCLFTLIVSII